MTCKINNDRPTERKKCRKTKPFVLNEMNTPKFEHKFEAPRLTEFTKPTRRNQFGMLKMVFVVLLLSPLLWVIGVMNIMLYL